MTHAGEVINQYKKPWYTIYFKAAGVGIEIRLNDIPVINIENSGMMGLELPVNEYVINGVNELKVITFPIFDDNDDQADNHLNGAKISVGLYVREDGEPEAKRKLITEATITPLNAYSSSDIKSTITINNDSIDAENTTFDIVKDARILDYPLYGNFKKQVVTSWKSPVLKTGFPEWQWQKGQVIPDTKETYNSLLKEYAKMHKIFETKDLEELKKLSTHRSHETAISMYLKSDEEGFEYAAIHKFMNHPVAELFDEVRTENSRLVIFANGRMATIQTGGGAEPVIYVDYEDEIIHQLKNKWYRNKNGEWVLIR